MDPIGNQPAQPNPQPPATPPPTPVTDTSRPEPMTPQATPAPERPVEAWPPAGTPAAVEAEKIATTPTPPQPTQNETQTIGTEVSEAAGAIPVTAPTPSVSPAPTGMDGFVSPAAKEIKDSIAASPAPVEAPMSDMQADKLFQEEPATKARNKHHKVKKILVSLITILVLSALASGAYIFFFGNKAAQNYVNTSGSVTYKEAFSQIKSALSEQPIDSAELEAGLNKLKVASDNSKNLDPVIMGSLNPNYKKAQQLEDLETAYKAKAQAYQTKYADYTDYLKALSDSLVVVSSLDELKAIDVTTATAEKMTTDMTNLLKDCTEASKALASTAKPSDLSSASKSLSDSLVALCTEATDSLEDGPLVLLVGKTGVLNAEDQAKMRLYLDAFGNATAIVSSQELDPNANIESLTKYQQAALDEASALLQEIEAILQG